MGQSSTLGAWVLASRPATLWAAFTPVAVGTACAYAVGGFRLLPALAALLGALLIQIGTNFANDLFDYRKGADTAERLGPTRAVQAGLLSPRQVLAGTWVAFSLATLVGVYLTWVAGAAIVGVGVLSIAAGLAYTAGPYPLGYHGFGDLLVLVFFGFVAVVGTTFVQTKSVPELSLWASVPVGALATAILVVNNLRDRETDARAGKRTLAVRFGARGAKAEFAVLLAAAYAVPLLILVRDLATVWVLLPLLTLPLALSETRHLLRRQGAALNASLAGTARLLLFFGMLLAAGLVAGSRVALQVGGFSFGGAG